MAKNNNNNSNKNKQAQDVEFASETSVPNTTKKQQPNQTNK
jgi:hypothetical protein